MFLTICVVIIVLLSSFLQTVTGFGYAMTAAPLLVFVMAPKEVIMFVLASGLIMKLMLYWRTKSYGSLKDVIPIFLASILGSIPGAYALTIISDSVLKLWIAIVLIAVTILLSLNVTIKVTRPLFAKTFTGLTSGFLASTTSMSGPPVILYYLNVNTNKENTRANLARYFLMGNAWTLLISYWYGTLNLSLLFENLVFSIPAMAAGFWLGDKLFRCLKAEMFRRLAIGIIFLSAVATVINELHQTI